LRRAVIVFSSSSSNDMSRSLCCGGPVPDVPAFRPPPSLASGKRGS
jgi:hypothetical protein